MLNAQPPATQLVSFKICGMIIDAFGPVTTMHRLGADPTSVLPKFMEFSFTVNPLLPLLSPEPLPLLPVHAVPHGFALRQLVSVANAAAQFAPYCCEQVSIMPSPAQLQAIRSGHCPPLKLPLL